MILILSFRAIQKGEVLKILHEGNKIESVIGRYWSVLGMVRSIVVSLVLVIIREHPDF
jgi:hypothetical protein